MLNCWNTFIVLVENKDGVVCDKNYSSPQGNQLVLENKYNVISKFEYNFQLIRNVIFHSLFRIKAFSPYISKSLWLQMHQPSDSNYVCILCQTLNTKYFTISQSLILRLSGTHLHELRILRHVCFNFYIRKNFFGLLLWWPERGKSKNEVFWQLQSDYSD